MAATPYARAQGAAPRFTANPFTLGVASGYPRPDGLTLWTRLAPSPDEPGFGLPPAPVAVRWEIAADDALKSIVASGESVADPRWAHSVHVDVQGLQPGREYWYRFIAGDASSAIGRTRTAPATGAPVQQLRFVFASCQHYEQGFFGAYREMVAEDPDVFLFLGDYIYETSYGGAKVRRHEGPKVNTLDDYRRRYTLYKRDPDLQAAHAAAPWIVTWDDHEVENDYAGDQSATREPRERTLARRAAAYQAYYENMPLPLAMRPVGPDARIYTSLQYGDIASFHVLDTRQYRTPQPCQRWDRGGGNYLANCAARTDPAATMLGPEQEHWFAQTVGASSTRWNFVAQQCLVSQLDLSMGPVQSFWTDAWDGYPATRARVLGALHDQRVPNPVFLGGDAHMYWVNELHLDPDSPDSAAVATEFVGTSVTSRSLVQPWMLPALLAENPHLRYGNCDTRGYVRMDLTPGRLTTRLRASESIASRDARSRDLATFVVENGRAVPHRA